MQHKFFLLLLFLITGSLLLPAQNTVPEQRVSIEGKTYILHLIREDETIFSLCQSYKIEQKELVAANPDLLFGLKPGNIIKIPVTQDTGFIEHKVKRKQTVFSIARQYKITLEELYRFNPSAKRGIKRGQILRIPMPAMPAIPAPPQKETEQVITATDIREIPDRHQPSERLKPRTKYFYHQLESGETLFDLEKRYGLSRDSLLAINPVLEKGILPGATILVPSGQLPVVFSEPVNENEFTRHTVQADENIYDVATAYHVKISELKNVNPELEYRELLAGEELLIPDKSVRVKVLAENLTDTLLTMPSYEVKHHYQEMPEPCQTDPFNKKESYRIAVMLPLFLDANDTINRIPLTDKELLADSVFMSTYRQGTPLPKDTFKIRSEKIIDPRSENFMHLYEGILMAADSLRKQGMESELYVFDTNRNSLVIDSLLQLDIFRKMDLIIGPVYPNLQRSVSAFSAENHIPMVSPLSLAGSFEHDNPYYFKVNPNKDFLIRETAHWITDEFFDKNLIVLKMGNYQYLPEAKLVDLCREKLYSTGYYDQCRDVLYHECDFETEGIWGLQRILSSDRENVFIIPAVNEGQISVAVTNLNTLAEQNHVRLVGLSGFKGYQSIQAEYFHQVQLQYLTHYFVDYDSIPVNQFIATFKKQFATEPNEFSFQGFDLAYYFMSALQKYGKDMVHCIPDFRIKLNQLNLHFQKVSPTGGYMNCGLFKIGYGKDFSIKNEGLYNPNYLLHN